MSDINGVFTRGYLAEVTKDVRKLIKGVKLRDAWVYKVGDRHWEFHYQEFYWHGSAWDASEARAKGWSSYLSRKGLGRAEGYEGELN